MWPQVAGPESSQSEAGMAAGPQAVAGPGQGDMQQQARDRDMDRHAMQSEAQYLFSGYGREERRGDEQRGGGEKGETEAAPLRWRQKKMKELRPEAEDQQLGCGSGCGLSLKKTEQSLHLRPALCCLLPQCPLLWLRDVQHFLMNPLQC